MYLSLVLPDLLSFRHSIRSQSLNTFAYSGIEEKLFSFLRLRWKHVTWIEKNEINKENYSYTLRENYKSKVKVRIGAHLFTYLLFETGSHPAQPDLNS